MCACTRVPQLRAVPPFSPGGHMDKQVVELVICHGMSCFSEHRFNNLGRAEGLFPRIFLFPYILYHRLLLILLLITPK